MSYEPYFKLLVSQSSLSLSFLGEIGKEPRWILLVTLSHLPSIRAKPAGPCLLPRVQCPKRPCLKVLAHHDRPPGPAVALATELRAQPQRGPMAMASDSGADWLRFASPLSSHPSNWHKILLL